VTATGPTAAADVDADAVRDADGTARPLLSFFIPSLTAGGAEQVTVTIVNGLVDRGYDVELLLSRVEGDLLARLDDRVTVVDLPPDRTSVLGVVAHLPALAAYLRRREPDALFTHLAHVSVVSLAVDRVLGGDTAVVPTHHKAFDAAPDPTAKDRIVRRLVPRSYPAAEQVIAVSGGVADSLAERTTLDRDDISVLYNPVDVAAVRARAAEPVDHDWIEDDDTEVVLFVGRIEPQKDLETWLRAFASVRDRRPGVRAVIAGEGSQREALSAVAADLGLSDVVSMPGYVENPYRYMKQADVFLLSSRYEGLPTVLIEALACGCPVVATDCPSGPREILEDGALGRLVPVGDASGLADAVVDSLDASADPDRLRARADEFSPAAVLDEYERFIREHVRPG